MDEVAFTTSIPVEVILAAGKTALDLNNIFIVSENPQEALDIAEEAGYPRNTCGWIKGLYAVALSYQLEALIAVMHGDCSNTQALMETLQLKGVNIIPFAYPFDRDPTSLKAQIDKLMAYFKVDYKQVEEVRVALEPIRNLCQQLDLMTWRDNLISGGENHYYLVSASDFNRDPLRYQEELEQFIFHASKRQPYRDKVRLAYIGVPPIFTDLYSVLESMGARIVYNEVQRQFSMPFACQNIVEQYITYTYPYGAFARLEDISKEINRRNVDGVIHYTQTFCYRQIEDLIFRDKLKLPFLTLEGDRPGRVDARSRMRIEAFVNMLK
ncbi:MAG: 2-hydroxyacyl-CoA dehydratase family protein [Syntrophomonadaceae bacterium]|jgi:benzoyl-CoA reductase/2-hydroxyglutaryl-CoA dehydratase subunit BcrC/BadD/HgdB